ncbi:hypothetical protein SAMN05428950_101413 [Sphingomonas sp. OV641]|uniref:hypothetical protein n=1 Tax=Sphingomonas sp. OV641 TaxID=1881068 RepID=UPI0008C4FE14|nr:hypothetical protein [Sphingomonas sp. OV641]SEI86362.1 hypothetical protein SAMN05428950_101413 [Sphingomonas sp. OV641]
MARIRVRDGETITTETIVGAGDALWIREGGTIARTGGAPAVRITGNDAIVRNDGTISVTGSSDAALVGEFSGVLDLRLSNRGTISADAVAVELSSETGTTGDVLFTNFGSIIGGDDHAIAMRDLRASTITLRNMAGGLITNDGDSDVVRPGHDAATAITVINGGTILAGNLDGETSGGDAIDFQPKDGGVAGKVVNLSTGHIEGGKHGITGANDALIQNAAGGVIIGRNGSGVNFDTEAADGDGYVTVVNNGLISGRYDGFGDGDGDGVDVDYLVSIRNTGTIEGIGADLIENFADGIAAGGGRINNLAGGLIHGQSNGILIDDGDRNGAYAETTLINDGTVSAELGYAVRFIGDFDDLIINSGTIATDAEIAIDAGAGDDKVRNQGQIIGNVDLGEGNDDYRGDGEVAGEIWGGAGDDVIAGGAGADVIVGGEGRDRLTGGAGNDVFVFADVNDSGATFGTADRIVDFTAGDQIDLSGIDSNPAEAGDQAFSFIGDAAFSGVAGELRIAADRGNTVIYADMDGDMAADFALVVVDLVDPSVLSLQL